jgi:transcriptional regulator with XRE-family HTH domain
MHPADLVRTVRRVRRLSQRELAAHVGVPPSTIDRIEAGRSDPRLGTLVRILAAVDLRLVVINSHRRVIDIDRDPHVRDHGGRQTPAHLETWRPRGQLYGDWWGWARIAWSIDDPKVPPFTYSRRRARYSDDPFWAHLRWDDAT